MKLFQFDCDRCKSRVSIPLHGLETNGLCPSCEAPLKVDVYPALFTGAQPGKTGESLAGCFYHPAKRAAVTCGSCGRFLCALVAALVTGHDLLRRGFDRRNRY